jgi:endoglucanase
MNGKLTRRSWMQRVAAGGAALAIDSKAHAQAGEPLPKLKKGINFSNWLANARRQPMFERDFAQVRQAGFDHIRLPVNPDEYGFIFDENRKGPPKIDFTLMDSAIALANAQGMAVILDVHPSGRFKDTLQKNQWAQTQFVEMWEAIAKHYENSSPKQLVFELLNEPQYYREEKNWQALAEKTAQAIRATGDKHLLVVAGARGSSIDGLLLMKPLADKRILYSFHDYEPYIITHLGVRKGFENKSVKDFDHLPYPSTQAVKDASAYAPNAKNPPQAAQELEDYKQQKWDARQVAGRIRLAAQWGEDNGVPVTCGEFGVLRTHADAQTRYGWMGDMRKALEKENIPWQVWDYADLFSITTPEGKISGPDKLDESLRLAEPKKGRHVFDPEAFEALGLTPLKAQKRPAGARAK